MASTSSKPKIKTRININRPLYTNFLFNKDKLPSSLWGGGPTIVPGPGGPEDLPKVFNKVMNTTEGFMKSFVRMYGNLLKDGYEDLAHEIETQLTEKDNVPMIIVVTGIIEEYADAGKTMEALVVYLILLVSNCVPNPYTYSVLIKALAADPDPNFLEVAKECILEMMEKGWQPNAETYTAVFKAFALQEKVEEGKKFREEMEAKGFVADKMAGIDVLKGTTGPVVKSIHNILFDDSEYSDSDDDDHIKKFYKLVDLQKLSPYSSITPLLNIPDIENDPENPKDLQQVFNKMHTGEGFVKTVVRMFKMLEREGFLSQAQEIRAKIYSLCESNDMPEVVIHTGMMEIYSKADRSKEALRVFQRMISLGVAPNAYTYSVLIKALTKDPDFLDDAKQYVLEMMGNGMQPNAKTYTTLFYAFAQLGKDKLKEAKEFVKQMKARGFVANKKAVKEVLKGKKAPIAKMVINILFAE
ncbi:pentatricopeptide repeat-containing protein [Rosa sericea]